MLRNADIKGLHSRDTEYRKFGLPDVGKRASVSLAGRHEIPPRLAVFFLVFAVAVSATGYFYYEKQKAHDQLFWIMMLLVMALIGLAGACIAIIRSGQCVRYYRGQYEAELNRVALLRHFEPLTRYANDGILLMNDEGNILEANERAVSMLGYRMEQLLYMNVRDLGSGVHFLDIDALKRLFETSGDKGLVIESKYQREDGTTFPVEASVRAFEIEGRAFFQAIIRDITRRKEMERALKLSEEHYRSLIESSSDCIYQLTIEGKYLSMNTQTNSLFGMDGLQGLVGREFIDHVVENRDFVQTAIRLAGLSETVSVRYKSRDRKGGEAWWDARISPVKDLDGNVVSILGISRDITAQMNVEKELKDSNERLRQLSAHLQLIIEEERAKIAREVHDELGQVLTALKLETAWLANRLSHDRKDLFEKTQSMLKLLDTNINSVKRICTELRPALLDHLGLAAAIEWQVDEFRNRAGINCDLVLYLRTAERDISTVLFRVLQEALTNIVRHAGATKVRVVLKQEGGMVLMKIIDNGKGIKKEHLAKPMSFGLLGMRERIHHLGGEVKIRGLRNKGTAVRIQIPADLGNDQNNY